MALLRLCSLHLCTSLCQISMCCRQGDDAPSASPFGGSSLCTQGKKSASSVGYGVPVITTRTFFRLTSPNTQCSEGRMCSFLWKALVRMPCVRRDCSKTPHILKSENSHQGLAGTGRVGATISWLLGNSAGLGWPGDIRWALPEDCGARLAWQRNI